MERIICLGSRYPEPVRFRGLERAAPGFPIWPCTRWGFPCRVACASRGALLPHLFTITSTFSCRGCLFSVALSVGKSLNFPPACIPAIKPGYAASRPVVFGLSSFAPCCDESDSPPFQNQLDNKPKFPFNKPKRRSTDSRYAESVSYCLNPISLNRMSKLVSFICDVKFSGKFAGE